MYGAADGALSEPSPHRVHITITSFSYLAFLAVVFTVYYLIRPKWQSGYLLAVSLVFYCLAGEGYTLLYLLVSTVHVFRPSRHTRLYRS